MKAGLSEFTQSKMAQEFSSDLVTLKDEYGIWLIGWMLGDAGATSPHWIQLVRQQVLVCSTPDPPESCPPRPGEW